MKLKATITLPNGEVSNIEMSEVSGDWKSKMANTAITLGMAALTGAVTYAGQYLASIAITKMNEASEKKKKEQK